MMRTAALACVLAAAHAFDGSLVDATEKCSACAVVTWELASRLSVEHQRDDIDLTGHTGRTGGKKKKSAKWMVSELRATELLEGLCSSSVGYTVADGDALPEGVPPVPAGAFRRASGERTAEQKQATHRLRLYCDRVVGDEEDWLMDVIGRGTGIGAGDVEALGAALCVEQVGACKSAAVLEEHLPWTEQYYQQKLRVGQGPTKIEVDARTPDGQRVPVHAATAAPKTAREGEL
eukprot:TRINITY_DN8887_c0_g1_i2.p1 TRINITY_DN8887_c0_g1~~TRINITY_DN8887_c0_g1_i2.p1  ORF type:complete len:234 (+),score=83.98 TRINITY_DN8887_c0_g1_i2:61-762(+)